MREVKGVGPLNPDMILIGEAPGEEEDAQGIPFVGSSGKIQDAVISSAGLIRERCWLDNVVPIRPPLNKIERLPELGVAVEEFIPRLTSILQSLDCKVVVGYGETALNILTGQRGISKHRGSIYPCLLDDSKLVIPTFHPRFIIENWKMKGVVVEDVKKAIRIKREGRKEVSFNTIIKPTLMEVENYVRELSQLEKWSFDIEVVGSGQIACIGIGGDWGGTRGRESLCIPFKFGYNNYWGYSDEIYIWGLLQTLFANSSLKIGQNINYDLTKLLPFIGEPSPPWCDLMVAYHLIEPELPHSLAFMLSIYTDINYYKDDPKDEELSWKYMTSSEQLWDYNGKDVEANLILEPLLMRDLKQMGMLERFFGFDMPKMRMYWRMQQRGIQVDEGVRQELIQRELLSLGDKMGKLREAIGYELNPNSNKQMVKFLYEDLKLPPHRNRKSKGLTADEKTLKQLSTTYQRPELLLAISIRKSIKKLGTYLTKKNNETGEYTDSRADPDGRIRGRYNICGTETGRTSSKKTYDDTGMDMQNIPESVRPMFTAGEGKVLMIFDQWQAETFPVAVMAGSSSFLERLRNGKKVHSLVGGWIFDKDGDDLTPLEYRIAKRTVHGKDYGLGAKKFMEDINEDIIEINEAELDPSNYLPFYSLHQCKEVMAKFDRFAPEIESWHQEIREELTKNRMLITPFGRKRIFRDRLGEDLYREGYAHIPQSTVGECNQLAAIKIEYLLPDGAEIIQDGFDSLMIEVDEGLVKEVERLVRMGYQKKLFWKGEMFEIPVELAGVSKHWKK